jgi:ABC-type uncharacterized transport system fused permease/ATPase subunit
VYYSINCIDKTIDNPDQRIAQDVATLVATFVGAMIMIMFQIGTIFIFSGSLITSAYVIYLLNANYLVLDGEDYYYCLPLSPFATSC